MKMLAMIVSQTVAGCMRSAKVAVINAEEYSNRIVARMGKCWIPDCEGNPIWFNTSWQRYCDEHVPEENPEKGVARKYHSFR